MESSPLEFARPLWLYAGPVVCVLLAWLMLAFGRKREADLAKLVHPRFRQRLMPGLSPRLVLTKRSLWLLAVLLLFTAVAGPRKGYEWREVKRRGIDILFAVDTSRSMLAEDLAPNRLERAKMGIHDFIGRLKGDRVGLIPFAGSSYALCPLTLDYDAFRQSLDALDTDLIPRQGTDVASAIREAERLFAEKGTHHRILVLITDGEDLQGDALDAAKEAKKNGMTIYPVGVGSTEGATIPLRLADGRQDFVRDEAGTPVRTKLDEAMLQKIAQETGGLYAVLGRGAEGLDTIYREKLRLVPQNEMDSRMEKIPLERFEWPLAAALLLLLMEFLLPDRRRAAKVRALPSAARRHAVPASTALLAAALLLAIPENAGAAEDPRALYNEGTAAYSAGDFTKASERLRASLLTPDLKLQNRAYYNLGNTLYRIGQAAQSNAPEETMKTWEEALKHFSDALALDATDADARHNQEVVQRKLGELKKQQEKKDDQQKDDQKKDQKEEEKDQEKKDEEKKDQQPQQNGENEKKEGGKKSGGDSKDQQGKDAGKNQGQQNSGQQGGDQEKEAPNAGKKQGSEKSDETKIDEATGKTMPEGSGAEKKEGEEQQGGKNGDKKDETGAGAEKKDKQKTGGGKEKQAEAKSGEEKKDGQEQKAAEASGADKEAKDQQGEQTGISEERRTPGEMTKTEARQLLQALRGDARTVIPLERPDPRRRFRDPASTTKGKTW